jgi:acyl carrier protein
MDQVDVAEEQITLDSDFSTELGFDSLTLIEFVMSIEEQFGISVPDDEAEQIKTVRQAIDKIELALAKQAA